MTDPHEQHECRACGGTGWTDGAASAVTTSTGEVIGMMVPADSPEPTDDDLCVVCGGDGWQKVAKR